MQDLVSWSRWGQNLSVGCTSLAFPANTSSLVQEAPHKFTIAVLMEYIRSLNQFQIAVQVKHLHAWSTTIPPLFLKLFEVSNESWSRVKSCDIIPPSTPEDWYWDTRLMVVFLYSQHYLYELVIKTLVQHNLFYTLHQFLQYHVLSDSKPLVCKASCFQKPVMEVRSLRNFSVVPLFALGLSIAVPGKHLPSCTSALSGHVKSKHLRL